MLSMLSSAYTTFGFRSFELVLSTRPPSFIGDVADWDRAETDLRAALDASGRPWSLNPGDGAFYGPKIDIRLVDAAGRKHQTATIQLDFQLPQRFDLKYTSPEGERRPVMIHRAILGSVERFLAILIEQCAGWWPFWLSPRQAIVLPVGPSEAVRAHAQRVRNHLALGAPFEDLSARDPTAPPPARPSQVFHVDVDPRTETLGRMVRRAQLARYNFVLIVGEKEAAEGTVAVRARDDSAAPKLEMAPPEGFVEGKEGRESTPELKKDMGMWKLEDLRKLFCTLDSNHL